MRSLFATVENYPELKANQNVLELQEQLTTTENQISFARQHYNATVLDYNTSIATFPNVVIAGPLGFSKREFFQDAAKLGEDDTAIPLHSAAGFDAQGMVLRIPAWIHQENKFTATVEAGDAQRAVQALEELLLVGAGPAVGEGGVLLGLERLLGPAGGDRGMPERGQALRQQLADHRQQPTRQVVPLRRTCALGPGLGFRHQPGRSAARPGHGPGEDIRGARRGGSPIPRGTGCL